MTGERHRLGSLWACARGYCRRYRDLDYVAALTVPRSLLQPLALARCHRLRLCACGPEPGCWHALMVARHLCRVASLRGYRPTRRCRSTKTSRGSNAPSAA